MREVTYVLLSFAFMNIKFHTHSIFAALIASAMEDLYQMGFIFLALVLASFSEDSTGAQTARRLLSGRQPGSDAWDAIISGAPKPGSLKQLSSREIQPIFENLCSSDFKSFRDWVSSNKGYGDAYFMLEKDEGAGWRLIFRLLARGMLKDPKTNETLKVTCNSLIKEASGGLFKDT